MSDSWTSGDWVRVTAVSAKVINDRIEEILHRKEESVTKNPELRKAINEVYIETVTKYVPYRTGKLLSSAHTTSDGRIIWSAVDKGYNYARIQYENETFKHLDNRTAYWTENVQPDTYDWDKVFIPRVDKLIKRAYKNG